MASKDPPNPADMHKVYISEARCDSRHLSTSERYRLHFTIQPPATVIGPRSRKSEYIKPTTPGAATWSDPLGDEFTVTQTLIDCRVIIELLEGRFGRRGRSVASCTLDLSSATDKEIRLDLKSGANDPLGELTICVASSLTSIREAVNSANRATQEPGPGVAEANDVIQAGTSFVAAISDQSNAWQPLLDRLTALVKLGDAVAELHPWIKVTWGLVSATSKIVITQSGRDARVRGLLQTMEDSCSFADEGEELKKRSKTDRDIINQIIHQVMECTYFIRDYWRDKSFVKRAMKYIDAVVDERINTYKGALETLRRNLIDHVNIQSSIITHRVLDVVREVRDFDVLSELPYAPEARHDLDNGCLPGTRTEIIDAIVRWVLEADTPPSDPSNRIALDSNESSRVLWLCGTVGAGKSSILRSCAKHFLELKRMGSYYGFDRNEPHTNLTNLFSTIARDLADLDNSRKQRLVDTLKNDTAIRRTLNYKLQFQHFIIVPFEDDKAVGTTVVFIDAFDESGDAAARADALAILTKRASELPPGLRIVITSRHESDIQDALQSPLPPGIGLILVDDIPTYQTSRDIEAYVRGQLCNVNGFREAQHQVPLRELIRRAGTSFQWAATACRFILFHYAGVDPWDRLQTILDTDKELYGLYITVMREHCNPSDERAVQRVKSILGRIICARERLSLRALVDLVPSDSIPTSDDLEIQRGIVKALASVLSGTHKDNEPIVPLHSSYRDFLCSRDHSKDFYIDEAEANQHMALACFRIMDQTLTFNICQIPSSYVRNVDIRNLKDLLKKYIPYHLSYACRFWGFHVSAPSSGEFAQKHLKSFFQKDFLPWLEVMSLMESSPQVALSTLDTPHITKDLIRLQQDARQFISMFGAAITTSMPHIYLSGLTFAPTSSLLYQRCQSEFPGVAKLVQGRLQDWPKITLILEGHQKGVLSVAFSPDGKQVASGSEDNTIQLWNVETGAPIGQMKGHKHAVSSVAFSPDTKQIVSGSRDKTTQLWSAGTGERIGQAMVHDYPIKCVAFSSYGRAIASATSGKTILLWDVETGASIGQPMEGDDVIWSMAFSPDGKNIASGSGDQTIQLWDVQKGVKIGQLMKGHAGGIQCIAFSQDGKQIASGSDDMTIRLWNVETYESMGQPMKGHGNGIVSIAFSPDGKQIASGSWDKTIRLWNVETHERIGQPMEGHNHGVVSIAFSPNSKKIVSGSWDRSIRLWNVEIDAGVSIGQPMEGHGATSTRTFSPDVIPAGSKHSLQYPSHLFPPRPSPFQFDDGWILGTNNELIVWVPPAYRTSLEEPHNHMGDPSNTQIDFQHLKCGQDWAQCRQPVCE